MSASLTADLRLKLAGQLVPADRVHPRSGLATGIPSVDNFLVWGGIPQGSLSLFYGQRGLGLASLWVHAAAKVSQKSKWVAFIQSSRFKLCPWLLKRHQADFSKILVINSPSSNKQLLWILQELLESQLFDLIGIDIDGQNLSFSSRQSLLRSTRRQQTAVVFLSATDRWLPHPDFSLIIQARRYDLVLVRAWQRPTPHPIPRKEIYANIMPQLFSAHTALPGRDISHLQPSSSLPISRPHFY